VFTVEHEPALFRCNACAHEWSLSESGGLTEEESEAIHFLPETSHLFVQCPSCGGTDFSIERGRGVSITEILTGTGAADADTAAHGTEGAPS
jgi:hydrogenase nickel incorporation protein HypA/HybF